MPKILAVDDSVTMRRILEMTFIGQDVQVVTADGGESGLRALEGADLILVDVSMPGMSGYDFAKAARGNGASAPIVLLASEHHPIDATKLRESGADDHVMKPFETQALIDKAKELIARGGKAMGAAAPRPAAPAAPPRPPAPAVAAVPAPPRPAAPAAPIPGVVSAPRPAAPAVAAAPVAQVRSATASFGAPAGSKPPSATTTAAQASGPRPPASEAQPVPLITKKPSHDVRDDAVSAASAEMEGKLSGMGLTPAQIEGVLALSREVIERVVWEVVPDLAETIIREEIKRLTQ